MSPAADAAETEEGAMVLQRFPEGAFERALETHREYLAAIPGHQTPRALVTNATAMQGELLGVPPAVLLRVDDFHAPRGRKRDVDA
jgi:hypothetical protein